MNLQRLNLDRLKAHFLDRGIKDKSASSYIGHVRRLIRAFGRRDPRTISAKEMQRWIIEMPLAQSSKVCVHMVARALWRYMEEKGMVDHSAPFNGWRPRLPRNQEPIGMVMPGEVLALRVCPDLTVREQALVRLLSETGGRAAAVARMQCGDITWTEWGAVARVPHDKVGQKMTLEHPLSVATARALKIMDEQLGPHVRGWLWKRPRLGLVGDNCGPDLVTGILRSAVLKCFGRESEQAARITCHGFRYAFANEMRRRGADLKLISGALGHSSIAVTDTYFKEMPKERFQMQRQVVEGAYRAGSGPVTPQSDNPILLDGPHGRYVVAMWGWDEIAEVELGPILLIDAGSRERAVAWQDGCVAFADGSARMPDGEDGQEFRNALEHCRYATRIAALDTETNEELRAWKRPEGGDDA